MTDDVTGKKMVAGFLFSGPRVLLVKKLKPTWQYGLLNGVGGVINEAGEVVRKVQNGAIPTYALSIFLGVVAVLFYFLFVG